MTRVMRARRDLVDQQTAVAQDKEFDAQHADVVHALGQRRAPRRVRAARRSPSMRAGAIDVASIPPRCSFSATGKVTAVASAARHATTDTSRCNVSRFSSTHGTPPIARPRGTGRLRGVHRHLALAVITHSRRLQYAGKSWASTARKSASRVDHHVRRNLDSARSDEALFGDAVLRDRNASRVGADAAMLRKELQRGRRHVLELGRRSAAASSQFGQRSLVQIVGAM